MVPRPAPARIRSRERRQSGGKGAPPSTGKGPRASSKGKRQRTGGRNIPEVSLEVLPGEPGGSIVPPVTPGPMNILDEEVTLRAMWIRRRLIDTLRHRYGSQGLVERGLPTNFMSLDILARILNDSFRCYPPTSQK